jgi:hypothetical protein
VQDRGDDKKSSLVNVDDLLALTRRLHEAHDRITTMARTNSFRRRWEDRLTTISEIATKDMARALSLMSEAEAELNKMESLRR